VTAKLDRAFRSAFDALATLDELKRRDVALHMIDLGGDVCGNGVGKLVFTILSAVAEAERDRIRERIRDVKRNLASRGHYLGGKRPYGFDVVEDLQKRRHLVPNEDEQLQLAIMRRLKGRSGAEDVAHFDVILNLRKPAKASAAGSRSQERIDAFAMVAAIAQDQEVLGRGLQGVHSELMRRLVSRGASKFVDYSELRRILEQSPSNSEEARSPSRQAKPKRRVSGR
jgi:hypothetical protein